MASTYPTTIDLVSKFPVTIEDDWDATSGTDAGTTTNKGFLATWMNDMSDAMVKVQTELGTDPSASFVDVKTRLNQMITVRKTASQNMTGTAAVNITDLAFSIPATAGIMYTFDFTVPWQTNTATSAFGISHTFPALGTGGYCSAMVLHGGLTSDGAGELFSGQLTGASGADVVLSTAAVATATNYITWVRGVLYVGSTAPTAGTYQLQGRSEATAASTTVQAGAHGILWTG